MLLSLVVLDEDWWPKEDVIFSPSPFSIEKIFLRSLERVNIERLRDRIITIMIVKITRSKTMITTTPINEYTMPCNPIGGIISVGVAIASDGCVTCWIGVGTTGKYDSPLREDWEVDELFGILIVCVSRGLSGLSMRNSALKRKKTKLLFYLFGFLLHRSIIQ